MDMGKQEMKPEEALRRALAFITHKNGAGSEVESMTINFQLRLDPYNRHNTTNASIDVPLNDVRGSVVNQHTLDGGDRAELDHLLYEYMTKPGVDK
jgi:hypothetical protein